MNLFVISHTHWDREWYQTYQQFRKRLVGMIDDLITHLEHHPEYEVFHMDGQTIVLRDYLEIRPEMAERLEKLISDGRIVIGPWYVMPDEFLVSGESLVRNLRAGVEMTREYGVEPLLCGYVTDIFGHNSQFPQILRGFGIDNALLYRGIGDFPKDLFVWKGADGSDVLALKMDRERSYSNFYFAVRWPFDGREYDEKEIAERTEQLIEFSKPLAVSDNLLMLDGVDHIEIEPRLPWILDVINKQIPGVVARQCRMEEYVEAQRSYSTDCETITGELYNVARRGVNNQLLKNVLSSMVHLKQQNDESERSLTKWAEPFEAFAFICGGSDNGGFLRHAWEYLLQNHPHDSICGCSLTEVHLDNEHRFKQILEIADEVFDDSSSFIACPDDDEGTEAVTIFNGSPFPVSGIVLATIDIPAGERPNMRIDSAEKHELNYQLIDVEKGRYRKQHKIRRLAEYSEVDAYTVAFLATVPACGYNSFAYRNLVIKGPAHGDYSFSEYNPPYRLHGSMKCGDSEWTNQYFTVRIETGGSLTVTTLADNRVYTGLHRFEDRGDVGDGWNWRPPLVDRTVTSDSSPCSVAVESDGPLVTVWEIRTSMVVPTAIDADGAKRSNSTTALEIVSKVRMKLDSPVLEFETTIDNTVRDHRLRVCFPTGLDTEDFYSTTPFAVERRPIILAPPPDAIELETEVFPNQGVVVLTDGDRSVGIYNRGLYECGVSDDASKTAFLTLFRSFGNEVRREEASMGYMERRLDFAYAIGFYGKAHSISEVVNEGEMWRTGLRTKCGLTTSPESKSYFELDNTAIQLSSFERRGSRFIARMYNLSREPQNCLATLGFGCEKADRLMMDESSLDSLSIKDGKLRLEFGPAEVHTIALYPSK